MSDLQVTSLDQLQQIAKGTIIPLPSFDGVNPFVVRAKRPSLLNLVQKGTIPNTLLSAANELFYGKSSTGTGDINMQEMTNVMSIIAEAALVEPTASQLSDLGLELTDEQLIAIFNYTQQGLKAIEKFRPKSEDNVGTNDSETISSETKSDN